MNANESCTTVRTDTLQEIYSSITYRLRFCCGPFEGTTGVMVAAVAIVAVQERQAVVA